MVATRQDRGKRHLLDQSWPAKLFAHLTELSWSDVCDNCWSSRSFFARAKKSLKLWHCPFKKLTVDVFPLQPPSDVCSVTRLPSVASSVKWGTSSHSRHANCPAQRRSQAVEVTLDMFRSTVVSIGGVFLMVAGISTDDNSNGLQNLVFQTKGSFLFLCRAHLKSSFVFFLSFSPSPTLSLHVSLSLSLFLSLSLSLVSTF